MASVSCNSNGKDNKEGGSEFHESNIRPYGRNARLCKYGQKCKRQDCLFIHSSAPRQAAIAQDFCRYSVNCTRQGCYYDHPDGRLIDQKRNHPLKNAELGNTPNSPIFPSSDLKNDNSQPDQSSQHKSPWRIDNLSSTKHLIPPQDTSATQGEKKLSQSLINVCKDPNKMATKTVAESNDAAENESSYSSKILPRALTENDLVDPSRLFDNAVSSVKKQSEDDKTNTSSVVLKGLESGNLPHDVPTKWKRMKKLETKSGGEGEVYKICLNTDEKTIAAIKIYTYDTKTRKMRAYRETTALRVLSDLNNVSHFYSLDTDCVTNIPNSLCDTLNESRYITFWTIMTHINGVTLKEFVTNRCSTRGKGFHLLDALTLTEKLLRIVKAIHAKGVVHRDLKPDNIMITFQSYGHSTDNVDLYVIDFGQAYIETQENTDIDWSKYDQNEEETDPGDSIGNRWYRVPQLDRQDISHRTAKEKNDLFYVIRRSPTIDASSICAIFFWMLTQTAPQKNRDRNTNLAPHQRESSKIKQKINEIVQNLTNLSDSERVSLAKRLLMYLMTMFDKGFEFPDRQWTMDQLDYRLKLIRSVLDSYNTSSTVETLDNVSNTLIKLCDTVMFSVLPSRETKSPLDKAASIFSIAKTKFIENHRNNYKWTDGNCQWFDDVHNMTERKQYDILTYYRLNQNWSLIVCCAATIHETGQYVLLSIGSVVHGLYTEIPIGEYETNSNLSNETDIYENFETELKNLIHLVCTRKADIQS